MKCHVCPLRQSPCAGPCACTIDGVDIVQHKACDYCPHPEGARFGTAEKPAGWDALPKAADVKPARRNVPRDQWPFVINVLAARKAEGERGAGDTAKRVLHKMGGDALAWLYEKATGRSCGCANAQERMNVMYPY